jgi:hypothetical protein
MGMKALVEAGSVARLKGRASPWVNLVARPVDRAPSP